MILIAVIGYTTYHTCPLGKPVALVGAVDVMVCVPTSLPAEVIAPVIVAAAKVGVSPVPRPRLVLAVRTFSKSDKLLPLSKQPDKLLELPP